MKKTVPRPVRLHGFYEMSSMQYSFISLSPRVNVSKHALELSIFSQRRGKASFINETLRDSCGNIGACAGGMQ